MIRPTTTTTTLMIVRWATPISMTIGMMTTTVVTMERHRSHSTVF
jgi:hypothetical protein